MQGILFVNLGEDWIRGTEQVLLDLARSLDPRRFRPTVLANAPCLVEACAARGIAVELARFGHFLTAGSGRFDPRRYGGYVRCVRDAARRCGAALIHCNGGAPLQFCVPAARLAGIPVLGHIHAEESRRNRFVFLEHLADMAVGVSHRTVAGLLADGMDPRRVRVIHNGIDPARFAAAAPPGEGMRDRLGLPAGAILFGSVGSLIRRKGHDVLIDAFALRAGADARLHLAIAGDGAERASLEAQVARLGLGGRVHLLGALADPSPLYRAADAFVLAARSEALPLVLIEAAMFGLPSIATDVGGVGECVADGRTGLLVPPEEAAMLGDAMARLAADGALRATLGRQARLRAEAEFGLPRCVAQFEDAYEELLARPPRGRRLAPYLGLLRPGRAA